MCVSAPSLPADPADAQNWQQPKRRGRGKAGAPSQPSQPVVERKKSLRLQGVTPPTMQQPYKKKQAVRLNVNAFGALVNDVQPAMGQDRSSIPPEEHA